MILTACGVIFQAAIFLELSIDKTSQSKSDIAEKGFLKRFSCTKLVTFHFEIFNCKVGEIIQLQISMNRNDHH